MSNERTDTERLEWLILGTGKEKAAIVQGSDERGWRVMACNDGLVNMTKLGQKFSMRQAIDAAMERYP